MGHRRHRDGTGVFPSIGVALETVRLDEIRVYITRRQNTAVQYIVTCPIMEIFLTAERKL